MKENLIIRKVRKEDILAVSEIVTNAWKTSYRGIIDDDFLDSLSVEDNYKRLLTNYTENKFIVAELNNEILGVCRYREENDYIDKYPDIDCEITVLYVKTEYKRKGIGKEMVNYVMDEFKNKGYSKMIIWCLKDNYPSRAFYEKMGGIYCGEKTYEKGNKEYKEAGYTYELSSVIL